MKILGREPALWLQGFSALLLFLTPMLHLSADASAAIMAVITALFGVLTAFAVKDGTIAAALSGLIKALAVLAAAFRWNLDPAVIAGLMVFVEAGVAFWLRTQVTAPVNAAGQRVTASDPTV